MYHVNVGAWPWRLSSSSQNECRNGTIIGSVMEGDWVFSGPASFLLSVRTSLHKVLNARPKMYKMWHTCYCHLTYNRVLHKQQNSTNQQLLTVLLSAPLFLVSHGPNIFLCTWFSKTYFIFLYQGKKPWSTTGATCLQPYKTLSLSLAVRIML